MVRTYRIAHPGRRQYERLIGGGARHVQLHVTCHTLGHVLWELR